MLFDRILLIIDGFIWVDILSLSDFDDCDKLLTDYDVFLFFFSKFVLPPMCEQSLAKNIVTFCWRVYKKTYYYFSMS